MAQTPEGLRLEKTFGTQARRSTDSLPEILRCLTEEHGFDPRADVAVSLPHHIFFFADVETDTAGLERFRAGDTASMNDYFPIPPEDLISQICSVSPSGAGKRSLLVAAASCEQLREHLAVLDEAKVKPVRVDAPMIAAHTAITANHPDATKGLAVVLYVDESTLSIAVTQNAGILLVRNLPMFSSDAQDAESLARQTAEIVAQEIEITWKRLFGKGPEPGLRIFLIASGPMAERLAPAVGEKIDSRVVPVDPYAGVASSEAPDVDVSLCVAEGLALRTLEPESTGRNDFLAAYRVRTEPSVRPRRELAICAGLAGATAIMWVVGLFLQLSSLESHYAHLKRQEETVFRRVAPEERTIVNPAAQLQQKLDALRKDCELFTCFNPGRPGPMEVLLTLSRQVPATGNLRLHETLIAGDSVRISGTCDSFGTFYEWLRLLENAPGLRLTDAPQPQKDSASQRVKFTVPLSTTEKRRS
jgi:Tfp pilus assembly protein PilN